MPRKPIDKKKLTPREIVFLKNFFKTGRKDLAAIATGSPAAYASQNGWETFRRIKGKIGEALAQKGVTFETLLDKTILPGLQATVIERVKFKGKTKETHRDVDHEQRGRYTDRILKLTGLIGNGHNNDEPPAVGVRPGHIVIQVALPSGVDPRVLVGISSGSATNPEQPVLDEQNTYTRRPGPKPTL